MIRQPMLKKTAALFLIISFCITASVQAQSQVFRHITPRDGLPSGFVWTMMQDSKGFVWVGTEGGLARHNGYSTIAYQVSSDDSTSISGEIVTEIIEYDERSFLVATNGGLDMFNPTTEEFKLIQAPDSIPQMGAVADIVLMDENILWAIASTGLYRVDLSTLQNDRPEMSYYPLPENTGSGAELKSIAADKNGTLWIGTPVTLLRFDIEAQEFIDIGNVSEQAWEILEGGIWSTFVTSQNCLIITSTAGVAILEDGDDQIRAVQELGEYDSDDLKQASFQSITEDSEGKIWLGTGLAGAIHWDPASGDATVYRASDTSNDALASDDVHYAFEDEQGNIWFGYHYLGVSVMYDDSWNYRTLIPFPELPPNDPQNIMLSAYMDDTGILWGSTTTGLIKNMGADEQEFFPLDPAEFEPLDEFQLLILVNTSLDNKIYSNAFQNGNPLPLLVVFDKDSPESPYSIVELPEDIELAPSRGLVYGDFYYNPVYNNDSFLKVNYKTNEVELVEIPVEGTYPQSTFQVSAPFFLDGDELYVQSFWFGAPEGAQFEQFILDLETNEFRIHDIEIDYPIRDVNAPLMSEYEPGVMYMNSSTGLIRVDNLNSSYSVLFEDQMSLLREGSRLMVEDQDGYVWLNNLTGLTRLDPLTETVEYFEIPADEFSALNSFPTALQDGDIIFPGQRSYLRFDPSDLRSTQPVGETMIASLQAGNELFDLIYESDLPEIESNQNTLTFSYFGLDYRDPASINYRYRILGAENEQWTQVGTQKSVFIPNLSAGDYSFEVQSGSQFGTFNGQTASLNFTILPPWWNTIPAYIIYAFLLGGLVFGVDRMQRRRLLQKERERSREKELAQAKEIEKAYENLKAAKEQLVQQEKLASLGQLTAGIAHEIKNPLNFVNNFSELSVELVEEARVEIRDMRREMGGETSNVKGEKEKSPLEGSAEAERRRGVSGKEERPEMDDMSNGVPETSLLFDILDDIEANLRTIHKHGSRADSIVKSMLQHSRGGSGEMEPADLNGIIKEYVNLSFHGMRASTNPINVDIDLQLDENIGEVPLVAEDFSRVMLNLVNNAFDALREKALTPSPLSPGRGVGGEAEYSPKLTVRTKLSSNTVTIEIEDNGPGIPENMKDKILQPFFTTKKGTQGTGLGLSITNDIIKAHGGQLSIQSDSEGATFIITLPV